jgi:hypothetical protein
MDSPSSLTNCITIGYIPIVNDPLSRPKVSESRRLGGVACDEAVRPTLQMRLKDLIDDVVVIQRQRVSDVPKGTSAKPSVTTMRTFSPDGRNSTTIVLW